MKKIVRLTESDLARLVNKVLKETSESASDKSNEIGSVDYFKKHPKGTIFMKPNSNNPIVLKINNQPVNSDLFSYDDMPYFTRIRKAKWLDDGSEFSPRYGFDSGNGMFTYEFPPSWANTGSVGTIGIYRDPKNGCKKKTQGIDKGSPYLCSCSRESARFERYCMYTT